MAEYTDTARFHDLEHTIEAGVKACEQTYREIGRALTEIRDGRLYKATHKSFDAYCRERWKFSHQYASGLIRAAAIVEELAHTTDGPLPATASQARALSSLAPCNRTRAWNVALEENGGEQPSSKKIVEAFKAGRTRSPRCAPTESVPRTVSAPAVRLQDQGGDSLDEKPSDALGRHLQAAQDHLLDARTALAQIERDSPFDRHIATALAPIGLLRFALREGEIKARA